MTSTPRETPSLVRRLGVVDAVVIGLGGMLGAGVFVVFGPAADAAGGALPIALLVAAVVAYCNATSSARLAARYPTSGGTYTYGRERLGPFWGFLAGWGFIVGKTASCAAIALTAGLYLWPDNAHLVAALAAIVVAGIDISGITKSLWATRVVVLIVLVVLIGVFVVAGPTAVANGIPSLASSGVSPFGVLTGAALLFFAFAGYARIATLGEEVRDPSRTIPRAIPIALVIVLVLYALTAVVVEGVLGIATLSASTTPVVDAVAAVDAHWFTPVVVIGAGVAALGSLLSVMLGNSRTVLAMARSSDLPPVLARVDARTRTPVWAISLIGAITVVVVLLADVRDAIGFSAFTVLVYYAIANAAALTLPGRRTRRVIPIIGLIGCVALACALPLPSVVAGAVVLLVGAVIYGLRRLLARK